MNRLTTTRLFTTALVVALTLVSQVFAADITLRVDGIPGNSRTDAGALDVLGYGHGISQSGTTHTGGGGAGKANFQDLAITIPTSKAAPLFIKACATGQHIQKATLTVRKAGGKQEEYLVITMENILVTSYQIGGSTNTNDVPVDSLTLNFSKVKYSYTTGSDVVEFAFDIAGNQQQ